VFVALSPASPCVFFSPTRTKPAHSLLLPLFDPDPSSHNVLIIASNFRSLFVRSIPARAVQNRRPPISTSKKKSHTRGAENGAIQCRSRRRLWYAAPVEIVAACKESHERSDKKLQTGLGLIVSHSKRPLQQRGHLGCDLAEN